MQNISRNKLSHSLVITTKNRREYLRATLISSLKQSVLTEILVLDDGSTDGTSEMVKAEFPHISLHSFKESRGLIARRNEGAYLASGDIIFSIDDDAEFSTSFVIEKSLLDFSDSRIGAVAIPYIEPNKENRILQKAPDQHGLWATDRFIGTAHALRRDIFIMLGGYRENLIHQGEEGDYCIRLLDAGFIVRLGNADPIIHNESPKRNIDRMDYYGCRNSILFLWQNAPLILLPFYLVGTTFNCLKWTFVFSRLLTRFRGIIAGYGNCFTANRHPVSLKSFKKWRKIGKHPCKLRPDL